jgi:hypothetical protein
MFGRMRGAYLSPESSRLTGSYDSVKLPASRRSHRGNVWDGRIIGILVRNNNQQEMFFELIPGLVILLTRESRGRHGPRTKGT